MRTFIAVEVAEPVRQSIDDRIKGFRAHSLPVKWVPYSNLHITLKFLGEISRNRQDEIEHLLEQGAQRHSTFSVVLKDYGCFPNARNPRVLWIGVEKGSEELRALADDIDEILCKCGFTKDARFHPHLTIGRIKKPCSLDHILHQEFMSTSFEVSALFLFKSTLTPQGAIYEPLIKCNFKLKSSNDN